MLGWILVLAGVALYAFAYWLMTKRDGCFSTESEVMWGWTVAFIAVLSLVIGLGLLLTELMI